MSDAAYGRIFGLSLAGVFLVVMVLDAIAQAAP
jgi:hypothetical protein